MSIFSSIPVKRPKYSRFNLSHSVKMTSKVGQLTPFLCIPTLPGDRFKIDTQMLIRLAPQIAPVMSRVNVFCHYFFVPNRLLWDKWREFITGGEDGISAPSYPRLVIPTSSTSNMSFLRTGSLADYLGFPTVDSGDNRYNNEGVYTADALPFRAYQLIYNEYYRDQNVTDEIPIGKDISGNISTTELINNICSLRFRSYKKDYFTSALPFAQRGADVTLPLYGNAEIDYNTNGVARSYGPGVRYAPVGTDAPIGSSPEFALETMNQTALKDPLGNRVNSSGSNLYTDLNSVQLSNLINGVDLSTASAATINELRRAVAAQEFLESMARGGSRYIEQVFSIFGVRSSDARLQRPEYLGGTKSNIVTSDVLQTSETTDNNPLGTPSGHSIGTQQSRTISKFCEEHGYIIGIMSIRPVAAYQQGMPRVFQKFDRLDYYWPQFAHLGEQEIKESEIYHTGRTTDDTVFGYTPRYAEYKYMQDRVSGDFKTTLKFWHMGRIFSSPPNLNNTFLTDMAPNFNRSFAVDSASTGVDNIWINLQNNIISKRLMPKYGIPKLI